MQRQHPLLSPTGLAMAAVALVVFGLVYWQTGGRMFNPGPLASVHADIDDCAACHQPLTRNQGSLCLECHEEVRAEMAAITGLHARLKDPESCMACHPDHRGAEFDMRASAALNFDHEQAFFSLARHTSDYDATAFDCTDCHASEGFKVDLLACLDCHDRADTAFMQAHVADFGLNCLACHDGVDRMSDFNHAETGFPLEDRHASASCADCHQQGQFEGTPADCAACHAEPNSHAGLFQSSCGDCHNPAGWTPALLNGVLFDHFRETGFSLVRHPENFDGTILNCTACHAQGLDRFETAVCERCHAAGGPDFMAAHLAEFGPACLDCHDGLDSMRDFDHNAIFALDGAHEALECIRCHVDHSFANTPNACSGCHTEPELHAGMFGLQCELCHSTAAWQPAALSAHAFPLNHGDEGEIACATCHPVNFVQFTCDRCHEPADMVEEHNEEGIFDIAGRCLECHPTGEKDERDD